MARLRFIADGETCTVFGATFHKNRWTASHGLPDELVDRLRTNPTFEVEDEEPGSAVVVNDPLTTGSGPA